jgi:hypothetical protein
MVQGLFLYRLIKSGTEKLQLWNKTMGQGDLNAQKYSFYGAGSFFGIGSLKMELKSSKRKFLK